MKKLSVAILTTLFALSLGCGDNLTAEELGERDTLIDIVPHAGEAITAIESAESIGYTDAIYHVDLDILSMVGDPGLMDELAAMPGISTVRLAEPLLPDLGLDLEYGGPSTDAGDAPDGGDSGGKPGKGKGKGPKT